MSKVLKEAELTTASARSKLEPGEHARRIDAESAIWYRKGVRGGIWFARWRNHGSGAAYRQAPIGPANDINDRPTDGLLTFLQAEKQARATVAEARRAAVAAAEGPAPTVRSAVEAYAADRDARDSRRKGRPVKSDAHQRLSRYVLGQPKRGKQKAVPAAPLANVMLHALTEDNLKKWCASLPDTLKATSKQRTVNDLKAALNDAYEARRAKLDPTLPAIIRYGLKTEHIDDDEAVPEARENQILTDGQVAGLIGAAREIDGEQGLNGDFFRLVVVLAATGARFSQIARMKVGDVQRDKSRLMVPVSRKGKGKSGSTPCPVLKDVLDALLPATTGRPASAYLLERQRYERRGGIEWHRAGRSRWTARKEMDAPWNATRDRAGQPEAIPYALRHSSIVRDIRNNLPIRLVAAKHDTSVEMIEKHYARWIVEGLEELVAKALVPLVPQEGDGKVTNMRGRA